jgi:hypothetical protein
MFAAMHMSEGKGKCLLDTLTIDELCLMPRDNGRSGNFWFIRDGANVVLAEQKIGEFATNKITIPAEHLKKIVKMLTDCHDVSRKAKS